ERALKIAIERTGWTFSGRPQIKVFPSVAIYRDATGEPGWVAASTLGSVIRLQPVIVLQQSNSLDSTLVHEFLHMIVEANANPNAPMWLREGVVIYLSTPSRIAARPVDVSQLSVRLQSPKSEPELRSAYRDCGRAVAEAVRKHGLQAVLGWLKDPNEI